MPATDETATRYKRLWFGPKARVTIGPGFLHRSGFGTLLIPHPPIANYLLRWGMPRHPTRELCFAHEFAHFQTAPLLLIYLLTLVILAFAGGRTGIGDFFFLLASGQAAWEIASEGLVMLQDPARYRMSCETLTRFPRVLFWALGSFFTAAGWVIALTR